MQNPPYHQANQAIQKLIKQFAKMGSEVLSSINVLTETNTDLFTNIPCLTSFL